MVEWKDFDVIAPHYAIKNKKVKAVYLNSENADEILSMTTKMTKFSDNCILTGFMSLQRLPAWLVWLNPRDKKSKYIFLDEVEAKWVLKLRQN